MFTEDLRAGCWPQGFVFAVGTRFCPSEGLQWLLRAVLLTEQFCHFYVEDTNWVYFYPFI